MGAPRPADPPVVGAPGADDSTHPDAEETDVFVVLGSERRARKERRQEEGPDPLPYLGAPVSETESEPAEGAAEAAPPETGTAPATPAAGAPPVPDDREVQEGAGAPASADAGFLTASYTAVPGGYEARITEITPVPVSRLRRAVFTVTGGRVNLG
ncbi:hypothetical protein KIK06_23710 [Nocardiopsis sp. EMB25]|uniref:hypothetical protein n=1 Tax=Nocardiopsis sp. EMB25 TaxID=2835867 RepID=UPI0022852F30|nr:hypothetical protein [Nocardiopsis sp. EMB25]MCY9786894.1 hypothetical protein [Nocardiopsis sp. EMB25]